jgi:hypothetical protein
MADKRTIRIIAGSVSAEATLDDSGTADAIWAGLPLAVAGQAWGDEIYTVKSQLARGKALLRAELEKSGDLHRSVRPEQRVVFGSVEDAPSVGYRPCKACKPADAAGRVAAGGEASGHGKEGRAERA